MHLTPRIPTALALGLSIAVSAQSAPAISQTSGVMSDNNSVTIQGAGFGSKSTAAPLIFDNFEGGSAGAQVLTARATVGQWDTGAGYDAYNYSTAQAHAGNKSVVANASPSQYNISLAKNGSFSTLYIDYWTFVQTKDNPSRNWKPWRVYGNNDRQNMDFVWLCPQDGQLANIVRDDGSGDGLWGGPDFKNGKWWHFQVYLKHSSSAGSADGVFKQYIDGKLTHSFSNKVTRTTTLPWDQVRLGHYWGTEAGSCPANSGAYVYIDNAYIDTSWAHVELGNASTYAASTIREVQIPSAWSDSSVTFKVNQGSFGAGETAYIYVIDSSGNVNAAGFPTKIGGGAPAPAAPAAPTGLIVR